MNLTDDWYDSLDGRSANRKISIYRGKQHIQTERRHTSMPRSRCCRDWGQYITADENQLHLLQKVGALFQCKYPSDEFSKNSSSIRVSRYPMRNQTSWSWGNAVICIRELLDSNLGRDIGRKVYAFLTQVVESTQRKSWSHFQYSFQRWSKISRSRITLLFHVSYFTRSLVLSTIYSRENSCHRLRKISVDSRCNPAR
jgi:hypothetical protein